MFKDIPRINRILPDYLRFSPGLDGQKLRNRFRFACILGSALCLVHLLGLLRRMVQILRFELEKRWKFPWKRNFPQKTGSLKIVAPETWGNRLSKSSRTWYRSFQNLIATTDFFCTLDFLRIGEEIAP